MEAESLKVLLIGNDERFARGVAGLLREGGGDHQTATAPTVNAGVAQLGQRAFLTGGKLAVIFTQFRRDERQIERRKNPRFIRARTSRSRWR